jgi:hypothetical protein
MLAGLLFAIDEAEDRPGRLTATLPFGGLTLIEHQARALIAAGASQLVIAVARVTPELLGALTRIRRRGVVVDPVRSAAEAADRLHPLARVLMLGDGLVTTDDVVEMLAADGGDALLVVPMDEAAAGWERVGAQMAWAGVARLEPQRVVELSRLPADYDMQSTLLRLADQAGAMHRPLPPAALKRGHGIERRAASLDARGRVVLASLIGGRPGWFDRWIVGPVARAALPPLIERGASGLAVAGGAAVVGLAGLALTLTGYVGTGTVLALAACLLLEMGATVSGLRDEERAGRAQVIGVRVLPAAAALATGLAVGEAAPILAVVAVVLGALAERAAAERLRRRWWGSAPAYLLVVALGALVGLPSLGLALAGGYAAATLAAAVERLREALASL